MILVKHSTNKYQLVVNQILVHSKYECAYELKKPYHYNSIKHIKSINSKQTPRRKSCRHLGLSAWSLQQSHHYHVMGKNIYCCCG